ncbi:MAG: adenylate/guanylate cyclase domain-containing protein [Candidatus Cybelea sp.]
MTRALPTGIVTFLFTDIEGSSRLWERSPDDMREALARHDAICRDAIASHGGVVFKTVGDAICSAFTHPNDALNAAIDAQRALSTNVWPEAIGRLPVRMALHSGECTQRDGDYFGGTLNRVARLSSLAYGDQILVSTACATLLRDVLADNLALRALGPHRLKDLAQPEPTFQVVAEGLRAEFPALVSVDARPNNLPSQISSFVGRVRELHEIAASIEASRLLTIVGPGGIGKTRLASQVAAEVLGDRYPSGAWFIDLTTVRSTDSIAGAVAAELGVRELPIEAIDQTLIAHLHERRALLILDNAEHVLADVAAFAKLILSKCADVTILATSREPLHVAGERIYRLGPLSDAPVLFVERARASAPSMTFGKRELQDVEALCLRLEGIPLAIELASARLSSMPLSHLHLRLTSTLNLTSKDSTEIARHRTLREMVRWSYDMLSPTEKRTLEVLSIFRGGCTVSALEAVASDVPEVDDVLDALVDKSLVQIDASKSEPRYRLLEVVAEYVREQLTASSDDRGMRERYAAYYAKAVATARAPYLELDDEVPNIRAALESYLTNDAGAAMAFIESLAGYWRARGAINEARSWIRSALALERTGSRERAALLRLAATFATLQDALEESLAFSNEALAIYRAEEDRAGTAHAVFRIAEAKHRQRHFDESETLYREALEGFAASEESRGQMLCLGNLGTLAFQRHDFHRASQLLDEAIRRANDLGERRIAGDFTITMGWVALRLEDFTRARALFEEMLAEKGESRDRYGECAARHGVATVALKEANLDEALDQFTATLEAARELQLADYVVRALHGIAAVRGMHGNAEAAANLLGLADRLGAESGRELRDGFAYEVVCQILETALPESDRSRLRAAGSRMELEDATTDLQRPAR